MSKFILPTLFSAFIGVWYYVLMAELLVLEDVPLHVFTTMARVFYGSLVSFPYDTVLTVILSRIIIWVMFFVLTVDMVQLVIILNRFSAFVLSDAMGVLFSAIFLLSDLFYMLILYHASTTKQLHLRQEVKPKKKKPERLPILQKSINKPLSSLFNDKIKF
jgi:hypothetical protein|tara:strand:+ start:5164 stop:5646 length:483 start_codon:yes stop_codon:yes gene_type:complete